MLRKRNTLFLSLLLGFALPLTAVGTEKQVICSDTYGNKVKCPDATSKSIKAIYRDNNDGTITDLRTGLLWQKDSTNKTCDYACANTYCSNLKLETSSNWKLPSEAQLKSITDDGRSEYIINPVFTCPAGKYWTSTPHGANQYSTVGFFTAENNSSLADSQLLVRCVSK